jgi:23S rRNA G2069 N7-methylase RlmK/C1962 C5-methylase RlmI
MIHKVRVFLVLLALSASVCADGLPRFYLDYAVVQHSLKNDVGNFDEFMKLAEIDRESADFMAEFWWSKAKRECNEYIKETIERQARRITPETSEEEKEELLRDARAEADQCFYGVYYDHWDEINDMVVKRYQDAIGKSAK